MATPSSKKKKREEGLNPNADNKSKKKRRILRHRTNDLPNDILQHIFSFLPIKSLAQTTVLSKYWKHLSLWRYHPHLDFFPLPPKPLNSRRPWLSLELQSKATEFVPIVVLSRRQQDSNITTFRLFGHFGHVTYSRFSDCINRVMKHRIEQLELDVYLGSIFTLPPCLFNCNTLRVLTLNLQKTEPVRSIHNPRKYRLKPMVLRPSYIHYDTCKGLPSLHTLSLTNVVFNRGSDLFTGDKFPLLRNLWLKNCRGMTDLNINCPRLKILKLEDLRLGGLDISGVGLLELRVINCFRLASSWAKICAASLRSIYLVNTNTVEFTTEAFRDLNTGFLCFPSETLSGASKFISTLCYARCLAVRSQVLESLSKLDSEGGLPCSFHNLLTLELHTKMTEEEITGITCLLRSSPILHTITIRITRRSDFRNGEIVNSIDYIRNKKQYWKSQIQNLKSIELHFKVAKIYVQDTEMHKSAVCLVKLLLRHGRALQEVTLTLKSTTTKVPPLEQRRIRSQIMKCARASTNVIISFLPWYP